MNTNKNEEEQVSSYLTLLISAQSHENRLPLPTQQTFAILSTEVVSLVESGDKR